MQLLLPPSETKRPGGSGLLDASSLSDHSFLGSARKEVAAALVEASTDEATAVKALKLGAKNRAEREHNLVLTTSGTMPAIERYTGVLYDALDVSSLDTPARSWVDANVSVQSALFGLVRAADLIPAYRLSGSSRLPALPAPLKRVWSAAHAPLDWSAFGLVLDMRSKDYAALAPLPAGAGWFLNVAQRGSDGTVRALNHFNKAAKGDLVRRLAQADVTFDGVEDLVSWAESVGLEMSVDESAGEITLVTDMGAPSKG